MRASTLVLFALASSSCARQTADTPTASTVTAAATLASPPIALAPTSSSAPSDGARLEPGIYGALRVAFDEKRKVLTASYESSTGLDSSGKGPMFTCKFYVAARLAAKKGAQLAVAYDAFDEEARKAWVEVLAPTRVRIHIEGDLSGSMASPEAQDLRSEGGAVFEREAGDAPEGTLRHVLAKKSHFFDRPNAEPRKGYVVRGDDVVVLERKDGWARVRFDKTRGWLDEADLAPLP